MSWGIGTKLITAYDQPALGAVYKIVSIENEEGEMEDTIKISSTSEKVTTPGQKKLIVLSTWRTAKLKAIILQCMMRIRRLKKRIKMFHPVHTFISKFVTNFEAKNLHVKVVEDGKCNL